MNLSSATSSAKQVFSDVSEKNVTFMAGGIAYNALVSLAPMLLLLLLVISLVGGGLEDRVVVMAGEWLPTPIANLVERIFQGSSSATSASFVGLVVLVWGTLKIFRSLDTAFSEIYETEARNTLVDQVKDGLVVLVALVLAIALTVGLSAVFSVFSNTIPWIGVLAPLVLVVGLSIAFFPMYYRFPDADLDVGDVWPGVAFAAVGWAALQSLFQVYLAFKQPSSSDFLGGILVVVTYLYFSGLVLLIGAVVNAVLGGHSSGAAGGVGRGATSDETDERSLDGADLASYLTDLREGLTGRYDGMRPSAPAEDRPRRAGAVDVTERTAVDDDVTRRTVTLEWEVESESASNADSDSRSGSGADA